MEVKFLFKRKFYEPLMYLFWILAIIFNAIMDTIMFHPWSWFVKVIPNFRFNILWQPIDPWHIAKLLMELCFFLSLYFSYKIGFWYCDSDYKHRFFWKTFVILIVITTVVFNLFLHLIF